MAGNLFNRYFWLIDLLRNEGPIPFKEISERWKNCCYNDYPGTPLPKKTFHNHCGVIAEIYGVDVECEKGGNYGYYIPEPDKYEAWKLELLDQLLVNSSIMDDQSLADLVVNDDVKSNKNVVPLIDLIKRKAVISFDRKTKSQSLKEYAKQEGIPIIEAHRRFHENRTLLDRDAVHFEHFRPLGIFQLAFEWWMVGVFINTMGPDKKQRISPFSLKFIEGISVEEGVSLTPISAADFSVREYLRCFKYDKNDPFPDSRKRLSMAMQWKKSTVFGTRFTPFQPDEWYNPPE